MLAQTFATLVSNYTGNADLVVKFWQEIEASYSNKRRYYHTLEHLHNLLEQLTVIKDEINGWDTILFSLYYHDIIYNPLKTNNEEASASIAQKRMKLIAVPTEIISKCKSQILATKAHDSSSDTDTTFFTDADLSILGKDGVTYFKYCKQIRAEYAFFPDLIYNSGRKKVLQHFLQMNRIFKTSYFYEKFELQARQNLEEELRLIK